ncbi:allophanate hydrolase [Arboricoccus pini]|uniref:Allophanate hydrolase n=1 Tax=Arboricoccus pini TaxID=1963835 RepID=A0A212R1L9_9PROT|nr:biotin-dependent carboxyltransferase family protein [Arboricoccus pini]SNB65903.1 allophanate hydrolase [Arboricoccus pini]
MAAALSVIRSGPLMSIQDRGRYGYRSYGVSRSGPVDRDSHVIANALVGNDATAAAIEFALVGGSIRVDEDVLIAVTGGDCKVEIDEKPVLPWQSHILRAGQTLTIGLLQGAVWGYLAVSGGIANAPVLGSRSTHVRTGLGGLNGKALAAGDILPLARSRTPLEPLILTQPYVRRPGPVDVVPGPQDDYFDTEAWKLFLTQPFQTTASRDRMGMVLSGPRLQAFKGHDIVSDATVTGSIQVPGSGKPIVLTADGQTTGGYPKIATVASSDLARLAQMPNGSTFTFRAISADAAEEALIYAQERLEAIIAGRRRPDDKGSRD